MVTLFVRHEVADYDAWRAGFDGAAEMKAAGGVLAASVYRSVDNPNDLTVSHDFASAEIAKAFVGSEELHQAMAALGVIGQPTVWIVEAS